jgi:hypothetical protein
VKGFISRIAIWFIIKKMELKYSWVLDFYIHVFPMKFKEDEFVIYKSDIWQIYYRQRTYRPYYYYLYMPTKSTIIYKTGLAEESELKKLPPVILEFY